MKRPTNIELFSYLLVIMLGLFIPAKGTASQFLAGKVLNIELDEPPLDVAVSSDGRLTFILTTGGKVHILDHNGTPVQSFLVGEGYDHIDYNSSRQKIVLSGRAAKTVKFVDLEMVANIDITGSPFKGSLNAPVTVAVFSDFQ